MLRQIIRVYDYDFFTTVIGNGGVGGDISADTVVLASFGTFGCLWKDVQKQNIAGLC